MSDFFREVDEELRNDRMKAMWKRYGIYTILGAVLIVLGTAGFRGYQYWRDSQAAASGDKYLEAMFAIDAGDTAKAGTILDDLSKDGFAAYPILAKFRQASLFIETDRKEEALGAYEALAKNSDVSTDLQDYATLQAAMVAVDLEDYSAVQARVGGLITGENEWKALAHEALALSAWKAGNITEAAKWVAAIKFDINAPDGARQRADILEDLIIGKGGNLPAADTNS